MREIKILLQYMLRLKVFSDMENYRVPPQLNVWRTLLLSLMPSQWNTYPSLHDSALLPRRSELPVYIHIKRFIWATTWQNQQSECAPSQDSDLPRHPPSLIKSLRCALKGYLRTQTFFMQTARLWLDWVDAQADLSLHWAHTHLVGFVMSWFNYLHFQSNPLDEPLDLRQSS